MPVTNSTSTSFMSAKLLKEKVTLKPLTSKTHDEQTQGFDILSGNSTLSTEEEKSTHELQEPSKVLKPEGSLNKNSPNLVSIKKINYQHVHQGTFQELMSEFSVSKVFDHKHQLSPEFLDEIDLDKIIQKRKLIATRKKILKYLKTAEKPEDTVSNPKYPNNWEKV